MKSVVFITIKDKKKKLNRMKGPLELLKDMEGKIDITLILSINYE